MGSLTAGGTIAAMTLEVGEQFRGSGADLEVYFFRVDHDGNWLEHNAIGRVATGSWVDEFGGSAGEEYMCCMAVWGMGDGKSSDVAQRTHEEILFQADVCVEESSSATILPCPRGVVWWVLIWTTC